MDSESKIDIPPQEQERETAKKFPEIVLETIDKTKNLMIEGGYVANEPTIALLDAIRKKKDAMFDEEALSDMATLEVTVAPPEDPERQEFLEREHSFADYLRYMQSPTAFDRFKLSRTRDENGDPMHALQMFRSLDGRLPERVLPYFLMSAGVIDSPEQFNEVVGKMSHGENVDSNPLWTTRFATTTPSELLENQVLGMYHLMKLEIHSGENE